MLVALAGTAGTREKSRAGKDTKVPPPATAFSVPAIAAAKNRRMAWLRCKPTVYQKYGAPEKDAVWRPAGEHAENSTAERSTTRNRSSLGEMQRERREGKEVELRFPMPPLLFDLAAPHQRGFTFFFFGVRTTAALSGTAHSCCSRFARPDAQRQRERAMVRSSWSAVRSEPKTLHAGERQSEARETSSSIRPLLLPNSLKKRI